MIQLEIGIDLSQSPIFLFYSFEPFEIRDYHAAIFTFPGIIVASATPYCRQTALTVRPPLIPFKPLMIWLYL